MKNKRLPGTIFILIFTLATLAGTHPAWGWGAKGHNAIAHIAQEHLSRRAEREVTRLLDGYNMAYWSAWADGLRDESQYNVFSSWHYANADEGYTYATAPKNPRGDVLTAVDECIWQLKTKGGNDSIKTLYLKLLIHFVGDMHCPMHAGRASDRGGNDRAVKFFSTSSNLHRMWDSQLVDSARPWSAWEWSVNIDRRFSRAQRRALAAGTPLDWMEETVALAHAIYADTPENEAVSWSYVNQYGALVESKFLEAGHRLARLLNEIFGC